MKWIVKYLTSSIGKKQVMGASGAFLAIFILVHMCGNLQLLNFNQAAAQASYNAYTEFLTSFNPLHFPFKLIYCFELLMVAAFAAHIGLGIKLKLENKKARGPEGYDVNARKGKKTFATFTMIWTGLIILGFGIQHLANLKFGAHYLYQNEAGEFVRDMWLTTIDMFANPIWTVFYLVAMFAIGIHLFHAIASAFQTMGLAHQKWTPVVEIIGIVYSIVIAVGFAVEAAFCCYVAHQPETEALRAKSHEIQQQLEQKKSSEVKASVVVPSVGVISTNV